MTDDPDPVWRATIAAALLRQGRWLLLLSLGLAVLALVSILFALVLGRPIWALPPALSLVPGCACLWFGMRVSFDADLFAALAKTDDLPGFDRAMMGLGLMPPDRAGRALDARITGAMQLMKRQAQALAIQSATLMLGVILIALARVA